MKIINYFIKKNTPRQAAGTLAHGDFQGELRENAPLESPSARVPRAGEIQMGNKNIPRLAAGIFIFFLSVSTLAFSSVEKQSKRIISLAPNITELLFAAGAGDFIVGASSYSDYPPVAKKIPIVADYTGLDIEKIVASKPDLVVAWQGGNPEQQLEILEHLGIPVYRVNIQRMSEIVSTIIALGKLAGTESVAISHANQLIQEYQSLLKQYQHQPVVTVFYEMSETPLLTLNKTSLVNQMIQDCGGINIFADTAGAAPAVNMASVLALQPDVIIIGEDSHAGLEAIQAWQAWPELRAEKLSHIFMANPDWLSRAGPRAILGMRQICEELAMARLRKNS